LGRPRNGNVWAKFFKIDDLEFEQSEKKSRSHLKDCLSAIRYHDQGEEEEIKMYRPEVIYLSDGSPIRIRPLHSDDKSGMLRAFERLSLRSRYQRFFSPLRELSPSLLAYLTDIDYVDHFAYGAFDVSQSESTLIGVARYIRSVDHPQSAEAAIAVIDEYHRRGLGKQLLRALACAAIENRIRRFHGNAFWENRPMLELLRKANARISPEGYGVLRFVVDFEFLPETNHASCRSKSF
jgi:GNAT superfamily N-acetyltransferase